MNRIANVMRKRLPFSILLLGGVLFVSFAWSVGLDREWGTDYGVYYTGARFLSDSFRLYNEHFDHKGPVYYLFLRAIGEIIGFGPWQAIASLFATTLLYVGSVLSIARMYTASIRRLTLITLAAGVSLVFQPSNASIALFMAALLLWALFFLHQSLFNKARKNWVYISLLFFLLAAFTRMDALVFAPIYLFPCLAPHRRRIVYYGRVLVAATILAIMLHLFFSRLFGYTLAQYLDHNLWFNLIYGRSRGPEIQYLFYRPESFKLLLVSGLPFVALLVLDHIPFNRQVAFLAFISVIGTAAFIATNSDKNYHLFVLYTPVLFALTVLLAQTSLENTPTYVATVLLLAYPLALLSLNLVTFAADVRDGVFLTLKSQQDLDRVAVLQEIGEGNGIFNRGWVYLFSDVKPELGLVPVMYDDRYDSEPTFVAQLGITRLHYKLLKKPDAPFIVPQSLVAHPNSLMQDLLAHARHVRTIGTDEIWQIIQ